MAAATSTPARSGVALNGPIGSGSALVASAPVGNGPGLVALNPATHTLYVANGYNANGPSAGGNTVSVIDARHCNAKDVSRCKGPWPTITVGNLPSGIAIDERTDTVYVTNVGADTVSVFNGATCNAGPSAAGKRRRPSPSDWSRSAMFADPANHTVYVANYGTPLGGCWDSTTVSMINSATCNATDLAGCPTHPPADRQRRRNTRRRQRRPGHPHRLRDHDRHAERVDGVRREHLQRDRPGRMRRRLATSPATRPDRIDAEVDTANDTLYTANYDNTVSAFDLADCDASDLSGCAHDTPGTVTPVPAVGFDHALWLAVDAPLHSVYVAYQKDDSLMVVDTDKCNGAHPAGCATLSAPEIHTGADPESVVLDDQTQTLYTANEVDNDVSVIDATRCNAETTSGCRHPAPEVAISAAGALAADPGVGTTYVPNGASTVAMINTSKCNALQHERLHQAPPTPRSAGTLRRLPSTRSRTPSTWPTTAPARRDRLGVRRPHLQRDRPGRLRDDVHAQRPGGDPDDIAVNTATNTIYVATITSSGPDLISVFNGATCDATDTGGCDQTPATVAVGSSGHAPNNSFLKLAINPATNTVYAANTFNTASNEPPPLPREQRVRGQRRHLRRHQHERLRAGPSRRQACPPSPGRVQPLRDRRRPSHRHGLYRRTSPTASTPAPSR